MVVARPVETLKQFLRRPEEKPALVYRDGAVTQKVAPKGVHSWLQSTLCRIIAEVVQPGRLAAVFTELRATFAGSSTVPDLSVFLWERVQVDGRGRIVEDFTIAPDITIEIISPGQTLKDLRELCQWYVDHGVGLALLVNPRNETIERFQPGGTPRRLLGDDPIDLAPVLPAFPLTVRGLFEPLYLFG
jgi:Uma2 family endonuclease